MIAAMQQKSREECVESAKRTKYHCSVDGCFDNGRKRRLFFQYIQNIYNGQILAQNSIFLVIITPKMSFSKKFSTPSFFTSI